MNSVAVYCGASSGIDPIFVEQARALGVLLASRGIRLVYGGGGIGLMGAVADGVLSQGGDVIGVIPDRLMAAELGHVGVADMRIVKSMHERKALMASLSDAFIVLPGGFGTMDELFEAATWTQLTYHEKPCGVLNIAGYFDPLQAMVERMVASGFVPPEHRALVLFDTTAEQLLQQFEGWTTPRSKIKFLKAPDP
ncbi:TIGR00730 family Rossman fold protein [bacterium]|nr:TIGR00730 family Rossman fold protein [bacterium]